MMGYGGGFVEDSNVGSQGMNSAPSKGRNALQTLRPVTIKQLLEAQSQEDVSVITGPDMKDISLGQVCLIACIRSMKEAQSGTDYTLEDGTGCIQGKCWSDKSGEPVTSGNWARVYASLRIMANQRALNIFSIRPLTDYNELTLHFLQVIALNSSEKRSSGSPYIGLELLTPIQRAVYDVYAKANAPNGLHNASVVRSLADRYNPADIKDAILWMISEGILFETHDNEHAKLIDQ